MDRANKDLNTTVTKPQTRPEIVSFKCHSICKSSTQYIDTELDLLDPKYSMCSSSIAFDSDAPSFLV